MTRIVRREVLSCPAPNVVEFRSELVPIHSHQLVVRTKLASLKHGTERYKIKGAGPFTARSFDAEMRLFVASQELLASFPADLGISCVGQVTEVGTDVDASWVGADVGLRGPVADWHIVPPSEVWLLDGLSPTQEIARDPAMFALGAVIDAGVQSSDRVLVTGPGAIGQLVIQLCKRRGATVYASSSLPHRRDLALRMGADFVFDSSAFRDVAFDLKARDAQLGRQGAECGVDVAIETSGWYRNLRHAIRATRQCGRVVTTGFYEGGAADIHFGEELFHNRLTILASLPAYRWGNPVRQTSPPVSARELDALATNLLKVGGLVADDILSFVSPADAGEAVSSLSSNPGSHVKIVIDYSVASRSSHSIRPKTTTHRFRTALIGIGQQGLKRLTTVVEHVSEMSVAWVIDANESTLRKARAEFGHRLPDAKWSMRALDAAEDQDVTAAIIATPARHQADIAVEFRRRCKHLLVEKPLGLTLSDSISIASVPAEGNPTLKVGFNYPYRSSAMLAIALCKNGLIGNILHCRASIGHAQFMGTNGPRTEQFLADSGPMDDLGIHCIDLGRILMPDLAAATGFSTPPQALVPTTDKPPFEVAVFSTGDGRLFTVTSAFGEHRPWTSVRFEALGTAGRLAFAMAPNALEVMIKQDANSPNVREASQKLESTVKAMLTSTGTEPPERMSTTLLKRRDPELVYAFCELDFGPTDLSLARELREFVASVKPGWVRSVWYRNADDCIAARQLIAAARASSAAPSAAESAAH